VHVQTPQKAEAVPAAPAAPAPQADAVQYDLAARRVSKGSSTDVTSNGK
jgi:hypothetical protein